MSVHYRNLIWAGVLAVLFFLYYSQVAAYWLNREGVDPLMANFVIAPALFGLVAFIVLRGEIFERILFLLAMPIIPCLILGQEGDSAKPGMQWILIAAIQLPYWVGGAVGGLFALLVRKYMTPNKSTQPTQ